MKKLLIVALLAGAGYYFIDPANQTLSTPVTEVLNNIKNFISNTKIPAINDNLMDGATTVYKYQDDEGRWHFSNSPIGNDKNPMTETYDSNANVISSVKTTSETKNKSTTEHTDSNNEISASPLTVYTDPGKVKKLFQDAKSIQQKLNNRKQTLDQQIDGLQ